MGAILSLVSISTAWTAELPLGWRTRADIDFEIPAYCAGGFLAEKIPSLDRTAALRLRAQQVQREEGIIYLREDVEIVTEFLLFHGEEAFYYVNDDRVEFVGATSVNSPSLIAQADGILYDNPTGALKMGATQFSLPQLHAWGRADSFIREDRSIDLENVRFSFCDPREETWHIKARRLRLYERTLQGNAHNLRLYAGSVPVLYLPYLAFPLGNQRRSGLLYPQIALDEINGLSYSQPVYFNIAPQFDATTYLHLIQRRGFLLEQELRWLSPVGSGTMAGGYTPYDDIYGAARGAEHLQFSSVLSNGWSGELLYTQLSDKDYLQDLPHFFDAQDDLALLRDMHIRYLVPRVEWQLGWRDYQLLEEETATRIAPYSQLPYIHFGYFSPSRYGFYLFDTAEYTVFEREELTFPTGNVFYYDGRNTRLHNSLGFGWSGYAPWGFLAAEWSLGTNRYVLENTTAASNVRHFAVDTGLEYSRPLGDGWCFSCQLSLQPRLYGLRRVGDEQGARPVFDTVSSRPSYEMLFSPNRFTGKDQLSAEDEQRLSLGLETRFINSQGEEAYLLRIGRAAYFDLASNASLITEDYSPWVLDSWWRLTDSGYLEWTLAHNEERLLNQGLVFKYRNEKGSGFSFSYYEDAVEDNIKQREQLGTNFVWQLGPRWSLFGGLHYDLDDDKTLLGLNGFSYQNCCVGTQLGFYERVTGDVSETGLVFQFFFKPLGGGDLGHNVVISRIKDIYDSYEYLY